MIQVKYEKGRFFIKDEYDNGNPYILDINTGILFGKRGKPINKFPYLYSDMCYVEKKDILVKSLIQCLFSQHYTIKQTCECLLVLDKIKNAGFNLVSLLDYISTSLSELMTIDITKFIKYCKTNDIDFITLNVIRDFQLWEQMEQFYNVYPQFRQYGRAAYEQYTMLTTTYQKYFDIFGYYYFIREYNILDGYSVKDLIIRYLQDCIDLNIEPQKEKNFLQLAKDTHKTKEALKEQMSLEKFEKNYKLHSKAFDFQTDKFSIIIPKSGKDLILEGQKMHHCVGGYVKEVEDNNCYIVFVRKNEELNKPYITAQVYTDGTLGQYYLAYDRTITEEEDISFRQQFRKHLKENW